jgi:diguanylate cyclase (GGDEF)-like protein
VRRSLNLKNKLGFPISIYDFFLTVLSFAILFLVLKRGFRDINWSSGLALGLLVFSIFYLLHRYGRQIEHASVVRKVEVAVLLALACEVALEVLGRALYPFLYIASPILFVYLGWQASLVFVVLVSVAETVLYYNDLEGLGDIFYTVSPLVISTFGLGYMINRNRKSMPAFREAMGQEIGPDPVLDKKGGEKELLSEYELKKRNAIRGSIRMLNDILSPHSIVLYVKGEGDIFEIFDFVSKSEELIDKEQKLHFRSGYFGWVVKTRTPVSLNDIRNRRENLIYYTREVPVESLIISPVVEDDTRSSDTMGVLVVDSLEKDAFGEKEKLVVSLVSKQIAHILTESFLSQKVQLSSRELDSFYEFTKKLGTTLELENIIDHIMDTLEKVFDADLFCITLIGERGKASVLKRVGCQRREDLEGKLVPHEDTLVGLVSETGEYFSFDDISTRKKYRSVFGKELDLALGINGIRSVLIYPLKEIKVYPDKEVESVIGCIFIGRKVKKPFNDAEKSIARIVAQESAKAISNSIVYLKVKELAITDGLTGLYNYRYFQEALSHFLAHSNRCEEKLSLVFIDVDNFKHVNDTYGHKLGDVILSQLADRISESLRKVDIPVRYGGDEFAVILPSTGKKGALLVAERIKQRVEQRAFNVDGKEIFITLSIGIATYPDSASTKDALIEKADLALYEAKKRGRNKIVHYEDLSFKEVVS